MPETLSAEEFAAIVTELFPDSAQDVDSAELFGVLQTARRQLYLMAYDEMCKTVTGQEPSSKPPDEEEFAARVLTFLQAQGDKVYDSICVRLRYCEKRAQGEGLTTPLAMVLAIAGILSGWFGWSLIAAAWLLLTDILDRICGCPPIARRPWLIRAAPEDPIEIPA